MTDRADRQENPRVARLEALLERVRANARPSRPKEPTLPPELSLDPQPARPEELQSVWPSARTEELAERVSRALEKVDEPSAAVEPWEERAYDVPAIAEETSSRRQRGSTIPPPSEELEGAVARAAARHQTLSPSLFSEVPGTLRPHRSPAPSAPPSSDAPPTRRVTNAIAPPPPEPDSLAEPVEPASAPLSSAPAPEPTPVAATDRIPAATDLTLTPFAPAARAEASERPRSTPRAKPSGPPPPPPPEIPRPASQAPEAPSLRPSRRPSIYPRKGPTSLVIAVGALLAIVVALLWDDDTEDKKAIVQPSTGVESVTPAGVEGVTPVAKSSSTMASLRPQPSAALPSKKPPPKPEPAPPVDPAADAPREALRQLGDDHGLLRVRSERPHDVYVQGIRIGGTDEWLAIPCGWKYVRLATSGPPPLGKSFPEWQTGGHPVLVPCVDATSIDLEPE